MGLYKHNEVQGIFQDSMLLFINDVEMMDAMFVDKQPVLVGHLLLSTDQLYEG